MNFLNATEARKKFFHLQDNIVNNEEVFIHFKKANAVLVNKEDYETMVETLYALNDPVILHQLKNLKNIPTINYNSLDDLKNEMEA